MLELKDISVWLTQNNRPLVEHFSFSLNRGDKAVIIGEEGNGKSTLLKLIYDDRLVSRYAEYSGKIIIKGRPAYLPQMMDPQDLTKTVSDYLGTADMAQLSAYLSPLGLSAEFLHSEQCMGTLSGGEKVKIQLIKILLEKPDLLLLDEPTNDLDIETLEWMENFILRSQTPILFVSHDETLIENTANVILHLEQLIRKTQCRMSITHSGYREYLAARRQTFDKQEQVAKKQRADYKRQMDRWQQIYNRVDHEQTHISKAERDHVGKMMKKKMKSVLSQEKRFERQAENFTEFPEEESAILTKFSSDIRLPRNKVVLDFSLPALQIGGRTLARSIRLFVSGNSHVGIIGRNGAGKSTLLAAIWEEIKNRKDITPCYMPQNYSEKLNPELTPVEYLAANYTKEEITRARTYMGSMKFTPEEMTHKISRLSGGQQAKILFLDMVLKNADVLLLDEPTRNFSPLSSPVVRQTLRDFGGAIISISHDRKYLEEVCDQVYLFTENGLILQ